MSHLHENWISNSTYFPVFFPLFCMLYALAYGGVFRRWNTRHRSEASSCFISLFHGTPAAVLAASTVLFQPDRCAFATPNSNLQNLVLDFSISYFVMDLLHYILFIPEDILFIAHHLATLFVFVTCRYLAFHGAYSLLVLLFLAEVTSFLQNVWTLAAMKRSDSKRAARIYAALSPLFYAMYTVARGFLGPLFFFQMSSFYLRGNAVGAISWWVSFSWIVVVGTALSISIVWIVAHWMELYRERAAIAEMERKKKKMM